MHISSALSLPTETVSNHFPISLIVTFFSFSFFFFAMPFRMCVGTKYRLPNHNITQPRYDTKYIYIYAIN